MPLSTIAYIHNDMTITIIMSHDVSTSSQGKRSDDDDSYRQDEL